MLAAALAVLFPALVRAQGTETDEGTDVRARVSAGVDKKISKGFHVYGEFEGRFKNNIQQINDLRLSVGTTYKFGDFLKAGAGYTFIDNLSGSGDWEPRHRLHADLTGSVRAGFWRIALRERIQLTHKAYDLNPYQEARNALALKSRLKVSWKGSRRLEPYGYVELRNCFNDPAFTATYNTASASYSHVSFNGYKDMYFNRFRGALGLEWKPSKSHSFDFYFLCDRYRDKDIDTNREGSNNWIENGGLVLKSLTYKTGTNLSACVAYTFSF